MALSHAILTGLLDTPQSGYELARSFETSLGFFWSASHQQIYQELRKLRTAGLVEATPVPQSGRPDKQLYRLTDAGRDELEAWIRGDTRRKAAKDDLLVKLYNVGHTETAPILEALRSRRQEHEERLALYEKIRSRHYARPAELPESKKGVYLALEAGLRTERMWLEWCDDALGFLDPERTQGV